VEVDQETLRRAVEDALTCTPSEAEHVTYAILNNPEAQEQIQQTVLHTYVCAVAGGGAAALTIWALSGTGVGAPWAIGGGTVAGAGLKAACCRVLNQFRK
jgi:hypothetical protein